MDYIKKWFYENIQDFGYGRYMEMRNGQFFSDRFIPEVTVQEAMDMYVEASMVLANPINS